MPVTTYLQTTWSRFRRGWLLIQHGTLSWAELGSHQPRLQVGRGRHHSVRSTPSGMPYGNDRLDCFWSQTAEALQCPPGDSIHQFTQLHSRERPSIGSPLTFEGHILQSCGADIHLIHSFLTGTRRLILSAATWAYILLHAWGQTRL